ncbi:MAG: PD-(D/E)XK nuclease family protein [Ghiorsea sp.]|nr:PD-(D/E)XK nuclease family protein [Ghiorsea sp.]
MNQLFTTITSQQLESQLKNGAQWLTVNQRLARFRFKQFEAIQIQHGKSAWYTPPIASWSTWLQQQWLDTGDGLLLSQHQEILFWRGVVESDPSTSVLQPKALAKQAMDAWKIIADYAIDPTCLTSGGDEHRALWRWANEVKRRIQNANVNFVQQHELLAALCKTTPNIKTATIILDGFDTFTPAQITFLQHLEASGMQIMQVTQYGEATVPTLQSYHDEESELRFVCQHIRQIVMRNNKQTIALFIPDLEHRAAWVSQILSEELAPALSLKTATDLEGSYFNLSLGSILAKQPMIQATLNLLSLTLQHTWDTQTITHILHSPYLKGFAEEGAKRASLDKIIRAKNKQHLTRQQLLHMMKQHEIEAPVLTTVLQELNTLSEANQLSGKQCLSYWLNKADELINIFGCFDEASLTHEVAQCQGWKNIIHQLSTLDDFCGLLTWAEALGRLQEHAFEQVFRPAPGLANIQVMGFLEASNLQFDEAFIISMDDHTWPLAAKPHPLIPVDIQVQHQTPHANSDREWAYAQKVWQNLMFIAPHIHVSYAQVRDHQDTQPSPLLSGLEKANPTTFSSQRYATQLQQQQPKMVDIQDTLLPVSQDEVIHGGAGILAAQSACAFQSFAKYRLHLKGLETPISGLNSREQGELLHKILEIFWRNHPNQQALLGLINNNTLTTEIKTCIASAWHHLQWNITPHRQQLETKRLQRLIHDWLLLEKERTPFQVVEREVWRDIKLGHLVLHTKLDRIDTDQNGHRIIIDYKTGESIASKALGDRPDSPQLPAYLLAEQQTQKITIDALVYAQVRGGDLAFKGFAKESEILPKIKAYQGKKGKVEQPKDWDELIQHWTDTLHRLADEFMMGQAEVNPKNAQACTYCEFEGLCRIER